MFCVWFCLYSIPHDVKNSSNLVFRTLLELLGSHIQELQKYFIRTSSVVLQSAPLCRALKLEFCRLRPQDRMGKKQKPNTLTVYHSSCFSPVDMDGLTTTVNRKGIRSLSCFVYVFTTTLCPCQPCLCAAPGFGCPDAEQGVFFRGVFYLYHSSYQLLNCSKWPVSLSALFVMYMVCSICTQKLFS